jgi:hypothetical protein
MTRKGVDDGGEGRGTLKRKRKQNTVQSYGQGCSRYYTMFLLSPRSRASLEILCLLVRS